MPAIFFETSALIEHSFWNAEIRKKIATLAEPYDEICTSRYVLFELARGFLGNLILLHNKTFQLERFSEVVAYSANIRLKGHYQGTVLGALANYFETKHPELTDSQRLVHFRSHLRRLIRRGWKRVKDTPSIYRDKVGCRHDISDPYSKEDDTIAQDTPRKLCGVAKACGVKDFASNNRDLLEKVRASLSDGVLDEETKKRIPAIRELYRNAKRDFEKSHCYICGDLLIVCESDLSDVILTKNGKHFTPLCEKMGRELIAYT